MRKHRRQERIFSQKFTTLDCKAVSSEGLLGLNFFPLNEEEEEGRG